MNRPETRYARSSGLHIAYQVVGCGPLDLVFVPGFISNLDLHWEDPGFSHLLWRLSGFARVVMFDKRGTGLSDPVPALPGLEQRMDDVRAVMDAAGVARAALLGASEGGPMSILFAATYPERTRALVLYGSYAHFFSAVLSPPELATFLAGVEDGWGSGGSLKRFAPGMLENPRFREWWARFERLGASPAAAAALARMNAEIDVRSILSAIRVPTLVVHRTGDVRVRPAAGRELARGILGARLVEIPGRDHPIWVGDTDRVCDEIEEFLTGIRPAPVANGVLATVVHAMIARGPRAAVPPDAAGPDRQLEAFGARAAERLARWRGRPLAAPADRALALFDGPARAVQCAAAWRDDAVELGLELRAGVHAGEVETGTDGATGAALEVARRIAVAAPPGAVLVSRTVRDLVAGSPLSLGPALPGRDARLPAGLELHPVVDPAAAPRGAPEGAGLTGREREILGLVARGLSNHAIAGALSLSEHTVKRHVANILCKLDLPTRTAASVFAARRGLIDR